MADTTALARFRDSDMWWSFRRSPTTVVAALVTLLFFLAAIFAPWVAPYNPFDVKSLNLMDAFTPPAWNSGGSAAHLLGTDNQGRDVLSAILYGTRVSLMIGLAAIVLSVTTACCSACWPASAAAGSRRSSCGWPTSSSPCPPS